jgi:hypothetical protein
MMPSAFNSVRPGRRPKYGKTDLIPEILVFFSWKKCGCGRTARVSVWSNRHGAKPKLLASQITQHCEQVFPVFPSPGSDSFTLTRKSAPRPVKSKFLPEPRLGESHGTPTLSQLKGEASHVLG